MRAFDIFAKLTSREKSDMKLDEDWSRHGRYSEILEALNRKARRKEVDEAKAKSLRDRYHARWAK